eukprot:690053-Amphidinium_carterae.1
MSKPGGRLKSLGSSMASSGTVLLWRSECSIANSHKTWPQGVFEHAKLSKAISLTLHQPVEISLKKFSSSYVLQ